MSKSSTPAALTATGALTESDPGVTLSGLAPVAATPVAIVACLGAAFVAGYAVSRAAGVTSNSRCSRASPSTGPFRSITPVRRTTL